MNTLFAASSATSLDDFLQNLPKKVDDKVGNTAGIDNVIVDSTNTSASSDLSSFADKSILDYSFLDIYNDFINAMPLILITSAVMTVLVILFWRYCDAKRSKLRYLTTLTTKHYTPYVFTILGKQCHLLAYRTGYGFALMTIRLVDGKISKRQHNEFGYCLASCLREDDVIGDYGNGHFKILLPYLAEVIDYEIVLYRLRTKLIRTSIGINHVEYSSTVFPDGGATFQQMLRASNRSFKPL